MARNKNIDIKASGADDPARGVIAINVSGGDQTLAVDSRRIFISTAGNLNVVFVDGSTAILPVLAGTTYSWQIRTIKQASTTAAGWALL